MVTSSVILQSKVAHLPAGSSIGWDIIRLTVGFFMSYFCSLKRCEQFSGTIKNRLSEMRKIVCGCIYLKEGFSGNSNDERDVQVKFFFDLLNSNDQEDVSDRPHSI